MSSSSRLFAGYRALGFVSNEVPMCTRYNKSNDSNYVITCVGRAFHVYNAEKLGIKSISDTLPEPIRCLKVDADYIYAAAGNKIYAFMQGRKIKRVYVGHSSEVRHLLPLNEFLISVDKTNAVKVWNVKSADLFMELPFDKQTFEVSAIGRPYPDKVLFGSQQGRMRLYKIHQNKILFDFDGWDSNITVLERTPATDVVAVGLGNGTIVLHDVKHDETLMKFRQEWGEVTCIAFRTDADMMLSGSPIGNIAAWDLNERKLHSQMRDAHRGPVTGMECLPQQAIMITSSVDNSIKRWRFDQTDGSGRLDGERSGFSSAAHRVRFHGNDGKILIASGYDGTLRRFGTVHDSENRSFGRVNRENSGLSRDNIITDFETESSRQSDWDGILAIHRFEKIATTWNYNKSTIGAHKLLHNRFRDVRLHRHTTASCVTVTSCGNFGLLGYTSGHVDLYNMQSGLFRGSFGSENAHDGAVTGVAVNSVNSVVITTGKDNCIKFWKFPRKTQKSVLITCLKLESSAAMLQLHRDSAMLALACDDLSVVVVDIESRRIVRHFVGPANEITDMAFTADGRRLIVSSLDSRVRIWDVVSEKLIDCFLVEPPVTSLTMSPTDTFLATTHVDDVGIYLWSNRTLYSGMVSAPLPPTQKPALMSLPATRGPRHDGPLLENDEETTMEYCSPNQIEDLLTLTDLPKSRWYSLFQLDIIKERNKPKEPPKVPENAPFFLPTVSGIETKFLKPETADSSNKVSSRILVGISRTHFGRLTENAANEMDGAKKEQLYGEMLDLLKNCGPSVTEGEFRAPDLVGHLVDFIGHVLKRKREFNLMLTYLATVLKLHQELIFNSQELLDKVDAILSAHRQEFDELFSSRNKALCLTNFIKGAAL